MCSLAQYFLTPLEFVDFFPFSLVFLFGVVVALPVVGLDQVAVGTDLVVVAQIFLYFPDGDGEIFSRKHQYHRWSNDTRDAGNHVY